MIRGSLSRRYARALMEIGQETGERERLGKELTDLAAMAAGVEALGMVLKAPVVSKEQREKLIEGICDHFSYHDVMRRFLKLLNQKGRLGIIEQIAEAYRDLADQAEGRVRASVLTAAPLSAEAETRLKKALAAISGKDVIMEVGVDEGLIGGVVARVGGKLLDGSVRTQLKAVESSLKAASGR